jgi:hypothetical protein
MVDKTPRFLETELQDIVTSHTLAIAADNGTAICPSGTAIFIAPQLAITARHVIEHFWKELEQGSIPDDGKPTHCRFRITALQFPGESATPALWYMTRGWCADFTDITFLELRPVSDLAKQYQWVSTLQLSLLPPSIGERIIGFGYPSTEARLGPSAPDQDIHWRLKPHSTVGQVLAVYEEMRDQAMLSFPCFEMDARFDGGMSGGPLFNEAGQICGLICVSLEGDSSKGHRSWGATLWPAMVTDIDFEGPGLITKGKYPVFELIKHDFIHTVGWDQIASRITFYREDSGKGRLRLRGE